MTDQPATRRIKTKGGDEVEILESHVLRVIDGLLGFPDLESYALLPHREDSPFLWLQSLDEPQLAFLTINPCVFVPEYLPRVLAADLESIGLTSLDGSIVLSIVVIPDDPKQMTANLLGPVVINPATKLARQVISQSPDHKIRHYILGESARKAEVR